jgi:hypothetical protein
MKPTSAPSADKSRVLAVVRICKITHAFDLCEWLCAKHIAAWRAKGATVRVGKVVVGWPCDRCNFHKDERTNP